MSLLLFFSTLLSLTSPALSLTSPSDVAALAAFKAAITPSSIPPWSCLASWDFSFADPCTTPRRTHFICGLTCTTTTLSRITAITLDPVGYSGTLTPLLSKLTALTHLDISGNNFHGPIISSAFSSLSSLQTLTLSSNSFSGPLLPSLFTDLTSLTSLDISNNALSGQLPFLSSLISLRSLDLSFNHFAGNLPDKLPPNLVELSLRGNSLTGILRRPTFESLRYLEVAELAANGFVGKLEGWFLRLPSIQQVDLANNSLTHLDITNPGSSTPALESSSVVAVDLSFNRIDGYLPVELAAFPSLAALSLRHNRLKGGIPWEYYGGKKGNPFRRLFLDGNFLNGKVPPGFMAGGGDSSISGSFGDNCLDSCPVSQPLCAPSQKPRSVCKEVYGGAARRQRRRSSSSTTTTTSPPLR